MIQDIGVDLQESIAGFQVNMSAAFPSRLESTIQGAVHLATVLVTWKYGLGRSHGSQSA